MFTDGWAPTITEPELIGIASESEQDDEQVPIHVHRADIAVRRDADSREYHRTPHYDDSDIDDNHIDNRHIHNRSMSYLIVPTFVEFRICFQYRLRHHHM